MLTLRLMHCSLGWSEDSGYVAGKGSYVYVGEACMKVALHPVLEASSGGVQGCQADAHARLLSLYGGNCHSLHNRH